MLAEVYPLDDARVLLDVGGGTGIYSIAWLLRHPELRAIVWDRPEVLKVAREMAEPYGVADRLELLAGDMFRDPVPEGADVVLLSNVLHDWDVADCWTLVSRARRRSGPASRLLIHDVFLDDALDGPLAAGALLGRPVPPDRGAGLFRGRVPGLADRGRPGPRRGDPDPDPLRRPAGGQGDRLIGRSADATNGLASAGFG